MHPAARANIAFWFWSLAVATVACIVGGLYSGSYAIIGVGLLLAVATYLARRVRSFLNQY